jgi:exodeoxyribonuclease VII small subunit
LLFVYFAYFAGERSKPHGRKLPRAGGTQNRFVMEKTFEASLAELETIVDKLENGDLPLEESLKLFETGVKLSRVCRDRLSEAERRIEVLMKDGNGNLNLSDLPEDSRSPVADAQPIKRITFDDE